MVKMLDVKRNITKNRQVIGAAGYLERGWVIANHKLVSFHAAFISSVLSLPAAALATAAANPDVNIKLEVLRFMFFSWETIVSIIILYLSWHIGIAIHETGHFLTAVKLTALNKDSQEKADVVVQGGGSKIGWYAQMFLQIPWGKFYGVKKEGGNFAPDAPYNLAVAASAPIWSGWLATIFLPIAVICIGLGLFVLDNESRLRWITRQITGRPRQAARVSYAGKDRC